MRWSGFAPEPVCSAGWCSQQRCTFKNQRCTSSKNSLRTEPAAQKTRWALTIYLFRCIRKQFVQFSTVGSFYHHCFCNSISWFSMQVLCASSFTLHNSSAVGIIPVELKKSSIFWCLTLQRSTVTQLHRGTYISFTCKQSFKQTNTSSLEWIGSR